MPDKLDLYGYPRKLRLALERVQADPGILPENKATIQNFQKWAANRGLSPPQQLKYVDYSLGLARLAKRPFGLMSKEDVGEILDALGAQPYKPWTMNNFRAILKQIFRFVRHSDDRDPWEVSWFSIGKTYYNNKTADDVLTPGDVAGLLRELPTLADQAAVLTLYWTGARITEAMSLKFKDVHEDENGWLLFELTNFKTNGKKRTVPVADPEAVRFLKEFLSRHPGNQDPGKPFFYSTIHARMDYSSLRQRLQRAVKRSGLGKPTNPHNFRHSRLTLWAKQGFSDQQLKYLAGWTQNSDMAAVYIHSDFEMVRNEFSKLYETKDSKAARDAALWKFFRVLVKYVSLPENQKAFLDQAKKHGWEPELEAAKDALYKASKS